MQDIAIFAGGLLIVYAMFRLIWINTHNRSNVSLTSWMLTGGLPALLVGLTSGLISLVRLHLDENARAVIAMAVGAFLMIMAI